MISKEALITYIQKTTPMWKAKLYAELGDDSLLKILKGSTVKLTLVPKGIDDE